MRQAGLTCGSKFCYLYSVWCWGQDVVSNSRPIANIYVGGNGRREKSKMRKDRLINRLRQLYILEFLNIFFLPFAFWLFGHSRNQDLGVNSFVTMTLNGILLLEGSYLWFCILRQLRTKEQFDFIRTFKALKTLNFGLFILTAVILALNPFLGTLDKIGTTLFFGLAILEHVNYFEIQLMYDNKNDINYIRQHRRLKIAKLKRLLTT